MPDETLLRLIAANDQDREAVAEWWREATTEDKLAVWGCIQHTYTDPVMEVMSRFAQLAFSEMAVSEDGGK